MKTGLSQENCSPIPPVTHIYWIKSIFSVLFTYAVVRSWGYTDCKIIKISIGRSSYINLVTKERHPGDTYLPICVNVYFISSLQTYSFILNQVSLTFVLRKPLCPRWDGHTVGEQIRGRIENGWGETSVLLPSSPF